MFTYTSTVIMVTMLILFIRYRKEGGVTISGSVNSAPNPHKDNFTPLIQSRAEKRASLDPFKSILMIN